MAVGVARETDHTQVRLAELVAALSLGIDLGFDQPMEHVLRQCLIALRLAERIGLDEQRRATVYYTALLLSVGCHADAHEQAKWFGDDIALKANKFAPYEPRSMRMTLSGFRSFGSGHPLLQRFRLGLEFAVSGRHDLDNMLAHHAENARLLGEQLGLSSDVLDALAAAYEQWDGRGWPGNLGGDEVPVAARICQIAEHLEVAHRVGGPSAARELVRKRRGRQFDPELASIVANDAELILSGLDDVSTWDAVVDAEPALAVMLTAGRFDDALLAIGSFVDLKSPYYLGHAPAVAALAAEAGTRLGLEDADVRMLHRAGLVHDLGRLGLSNAILDKRSPLGAGEWERLRLQPYLTERMLRQSPTLAPLGRIAVQHRERVDGSGYPSGSQRGAIVPLAQILGAADAYQAMREPRPQRAALSSDEAAAELRREVGAGRFDADIAEAVLGSAGHRVQKRREGPAGLTPREIEVLKLLARGLSNKEIARELTIAPKTVGNHVEHIYAKIAVPTRAAAAIFAVSHGLLP